MVSLAKVVIVVEYRSKTMAVCSNWGVMMHRGPGLARQRVQRVLEADLTTIFMYH